MAWRWGALLAFALFGPVALPAGGSDLKQPEVRRRRAIHDPLVTEAECALRSSPMRAAPSLARVEIGTPLEVLRSWTTSSGQEWLHVEVRSEDLLVVRRGWVSTA